MPLPDSGPHFQPHVLDLQVLPSHPPLCESSSQCVQPLMEADITSLHIRLPVASLQKEYESDSKSKVCSYFSLEPEEGKFL